MNWYVVVVALALALALALLASRRKTESFELPPMTFSQLPVDKTYVFATPIPDDASAFDKQLFAFTDARVPRNVISEARPEPVPYVDSEIQGIAERALARAKSVGLQYISTEFATKAVDSLGGAAYEIAFIAYDPLKNFAVKLALEALVTKGNAMFIKTFKSFNRPESANDPTAPTGASDFAGRDAPFEQDLGIDYVKLYG